MFYSKDKLQSIKDTAIGGDIVTILFRQAVRLRGVLLGSNQVGWPKYTPPAVFLAGIPISVKQQETYSFEADMTQHAVESGELLSDHVILKPLRISIAAEVTNWEAGTAAFALDSLEQLWRARVPIDLQTLHKTIPNMVLVSFEADNSTPNWGSLAFKATFQSLPLATLETTDYPEEKIKPTIKTSGPDISKAATPEVKGGKQRTSRLLAIKRSIFEDN